ncbi:hypothetical protein C0V75_15405 [Tabrizicola sp. TH137]|uniref:hypothetical protein n=1 Tax=Tabrizicola sp. TH137 TaxID=2067452 RepID=UPI000C7D4D1A|nr:hypothetical protein [Tabrizicola sp. TH137]PLL11415.1 hypothetical protein C0V75_15405 [Tabrizicola sp. TH137]
MTWIGHNGGPSPEPGQTWRRHCWQQARERLLPTLPVEVVRLRVKRAAELGLDYRTYASVRAATGHDVVAFLFSSNALRLLAPASVLPADRAAKLASLADCGRVALAIRPLTVADVARAATARAGGPLLEAVHPAPDLLGRWREAGLALRSALGQVPGDRVILVGETALERDWCAAGRLAGWIAADRYFGA